MDPPARVGNVSLLYSKPEHLKNSIFQGSIAVMDLLHHDVGTMMTRTQLSFEREMLRRARLKAGQMGISLAEYVRRLVAEDLGESPSQADSSTIFNLGSSGGSDIAREKDAMLGQALSKGSS